MPRFMPVGTPQSINQQKPRMPKPPMSSGPPHTMGVGGSGAQGDVKFITVNGRVIPIRQKTGAGGGGMSMGAKIATGAGLLGAGVLGAMALKRGMMPGVGQKIGNIAGNIGSGAKNMAYGAGNMIGKARNYLGNVSHNISQSPIAQKIKAGPIGNIGRKIEAGPIGQGFRKVTKHMDIGDAAEIADAGIGAASLGAGAAGAVAIENRRKKGKKLSEEGELVIPISSFSLSELFDEDQISQILAEIQAEVGEFDTYDITEEGLRFGEYLIAHEDLVRISLALMES